MLIPYLALEACNNGKQTWAEKFKVVKSKQAQWGIIVKNNADNFLISNLSKL